MFKYYTGQGYINQSNQFAVERQRACVREKHVDYNYQNSNLN